MEFVLLTVGPARAVSFRSTDKLLEKDVKKSKLTSDEAQAIKDRVKTASDIAELGKADVQLVMEVRWGRRYQRMICLPSAFR